MAWLTARDGCSNNFADVTGIKLSFIFVYNPMAQSRHLTRRTSASGTWKPRIAPFGGSRLQSLPMAVREQDWGESERCPVIGRIGVETSPYAKAGRLPLGLSPQERL